MNQKKMKALAKKLEKEGKDFTFLISSERANQAYLGGVPTDLVKLLINSVVKISEKKKVSDVEVVSALKKWGQEMGLIEVDNPEDLPNLNLPE